jgi:sulfate/thiosulfate transport system permease protein
MNAPLQTPRAKSITSIVAIERRRADVLAEPAWVRRTLIGAALAFLLAFLVVPLVAVFVLALKDGPAAYLEAILRPDTIASVKLTLLVAALALPVNVVFGVAAAWLIAKFRFRGKGLLLTLIDLPFSVSPVVAGLIFVLLFGRQGLLGPFLSAHDVKIIFAVPGIVLTTTFVTLPFVARELIPLLSAQGNDAEEAAYTLGASAWRTFFVVTLPKIKWALLYGVVLANARAMGEFGAVSVVSGHIRGVTNTMPLQAEILYNEYNFVGAFAVASLLTLLALVTLIAKKIVEARA